ncbi:MAG: hypothetical protein PHT57_06850 [Rhodoferax sp.]|nr:hypothetical protein [Rhodoferax sp.]
MKFFNFLKNWLCDIKILTKNDIFIFLILVLMLVFPLHKTFNFEEMKYEFIALIGNSFLSTIIVLIWFKYKYKSDCWRPDFYLLAAGLLVIIFMLGLFWIDENYGVARIQNERLAAPSVNMDALGESCILSIGKNEYNNGCSIYYIMAIKSLFDNNFSKPINDFPWRSLTAFFGVFQGGLVAAFLYAWVTSPRQKRSYKGHPR